MFPYKTILCPTDFSEASYKALEESKKIAEKFSAKLLVIHVIAPIPATDIYSNLTPSDFDIVSLEESLREGVNKKLTELMDERLQNMDANAAVAHGDPGDEIVAFSEESNVDLIVIATHGMKGWQHALFGSVAQKVIRKTARNILLVQPDSNQDSER